MGTRALMTRILCNAAVTLHATATTSDIDVHSVNTVWTAFAISGTRHCQFGIWAAWPSRTKSLRHCPEATIMLFILPVLNAKVTHDTSSHNFNITPSSILH
ncbi:hypothetical protein Pelo_15056 [Pelomyxa schiedti]|nr:hypothetical protein Pelo_15056 [Pelomyxa schiedti]